MGVVKDVGEFEHLKAYLLFIAKELNTYEKQVYLARDPKSFERKFIDEYRAKEHHKFYEIEIRTFLNTLPVNPRLKLKCVEFLLEGLEREVWFLSGDKIDVLGQLWDHFGRKLKKFDENINK